MVRRARVGVGAARRIVRVPLGIDTTRHLYCEICERSLAGEVLAGRARKRALRAGRGAGGSAARAREDDGLCKLSERARSVRG